MNVLLIIITILLTLIIPIIMLKNFVDIYRTLKDKRKIVRGIKAFWLALMMTFIDAL